VKSYDVAVIGGGVIGAACARAAASRGLRVAVFEPGPDPGAASPASAGMLAAQIEPMADDALRLSLLARRRYESLVPLLSEATGIDLSYWQAGIAALAFDDAAVDRLTTTAAVQRQAGLHCDWLTTDAVLERWPGVAPDCRGALFAPEDGALDPQALTRALLGDAERSGATLVRERVTAVRIAGSQATGVVIGQEATPAAQVVVAAGSWSPAIGGLPNRLPVQPVRGQMAATPWPRAVPPSILYYDHSYVLARGAEALLGSTMEHAGFDARVTNEGLAHIFRSAARVLPALMRQPVVRMWAGLRPVSPDGQPIVGADPEIGALWYATGHGRNGVLFAALTGEVIGDLLSAEKTDLDIRPWRPDRPGVLGTQEPLPDQPNG
jgi:glycine oxidase ThiO